jgi:putative SOS response-associated peptidase YedK
VPASETYGIARQTFTILTTEANQTLSRLHDRMLVVLDKSSWAEWLDPMTRVDKAQALLLPADEADFHAYRVTPKVGRSDFENPLAHAPLPDLELDLGDAAF